MVYPEEAFTFVVPAGHEARLRPGRFVLSPAVVEVDGFAPLTVLTPDLSLSLALSAPPLNVAGAPEV